MNFLFLQFTRKSSPAFGDRAEEQIRSELFSTERLEQHAESLAAAQRTTGKPLTAGNLARRLRDNGQMLLTAYRTIADSIREERAITPAAEWLIDNFHVVEEQIREIRADLPAGFYRELPKLAEGHLAGYPRVFGIAWAFVAHTDSRFDTETLCRFVKAYQRVQPLSIGELWAVAITLRIVLVENLRRSAEQIVRRRIARQQADDLADRLLSAGNRDRHALEAMFESYNRKPLPTTFAVQMVQRLRDQDPAVIPALRWLEGRLTTQGTNPDEIVRREQQEQAEMNVTVRNVITSMRLMSAVDWRKLFEKVSLVDEELRAGSDFAAMDFPTRDRYRHTIEELARGSGLTELEVTRRAIRAARSASEQSHAEPADARKQDPGYYLISSGRTAFEQELGFRPALKRWLGRAYTSAGIFGYLGAIILLSALFLGLGLLGVRETGLNGPIFYLLALLGLVAATDAAVAIMNFDVTNQFSPAALPGLELRDGVPARFRTLVAVPTMLRSPTEIDELVERLEVHFLACPGDDLHFAILSDWADWASEKSPHDDELLSRAADGIARLNKKYGVGQAGDRFLLLHRRRLWNKAEGAWIGWERKRGKLHELNRLLRGATDTTFITINGRPPAIPAGIQYVITLDTDTRMPRGAARKLVGKMAHPLNRPLFDPRAGRVVEGYAVLQPKVTPSLPTSHQATPFQRLFSGPAGMDPYAFTVSDVYQDLLGEGSYTGKGIYDVDAFEASMYSRIPENTVLSHDLVEGTFARAGLATDIEVFEEFPARYDVAVARQHRWARGDWQLLPWVIGSGRDRSRNPARKQIPVLGRWKMMDNLRRTLSPPAAFLALLAGWILPELPAKLWSVFVVGMITLPHFLPFLVGILPRRLGISKRSYLRSVGTDLVLALAQNVFLVMLLAHQSWIMADAIVRTLFRMFVTHKKMLQWVTAAQASRTEAPDIRGFYKQMAGGLVLATGGVIAVGMTNPAIWPLATLFLILWIAAPAAADWSSRPAEALVGPEIPSAEDARTLRLTARRTWHFFETFVSAEDHMLPPDNFQEDPQPVVAHRTSPTNIGLYLLSVTAAHDFGWLGTGESVDRLEATLASMKQLPKFRGHFFNWYDTRDLRPLDPQYVSSVDSGNLAGHLVALRNALREILEAPPLSSQWQTGAMDALILAKEALDAVVVEHPTRTTTEKQLAGRLEKLEALLARVPPSPSDLAGDFKELTRIVETVADLARIMAEERGSDASRAVITWAEALSAAIGSHRRDLERLAPWMFLLQAGGPGEAPEQDRESPEAIVRGVFATFPPLHAIADRCEAAIEKLTFLPAESNGGVADRIKALVDALAHASRTAAQLEKRIASLIDLAGEMFDSMAFGFLIDSDRHLLSIGYRVADGTLDPSCYDLLASEARLASFIAIAKGDAPVQHWFRLERSLTPVHRGSALISWSGSMFEYLMPSLVMRAPVGSLLEQTIFFVVHRQIQYGNELNVPWGVSESAYNARDLEFIYQYSNFGVPGLGLKRGLSSDVVIAPYATALASMVVPGPAASNLRRLAAEGGLGHYGYYEALDYTPERLPEGESVAVVHAYMAHHQGMSLVAIGNELHAGAMRRRFHAEPIIQATELLLQERTPRDVAIARPRAEEVESAARILDIVPPIHRRISSPHDVVPRTNILSNGRYAVMVTSAGSGYSRCGNLSVTRWREDVTCDSWGSYIFLRDIGTGDVWSAGFQPRCVEPESYEVGFTEDRVEIVRNDGTLTTTMEITVSPEHDGEVRRVSISNHGSRGREIELTSYAEIVLAPPADDAAHPAFSKMFVQTEFVASESTLLATRRRRSRNEPEIWAAHLAVVEGDLQGEMQYETDRTRFLGRGNEIRTPTAVMLGLPLSNTTGTVLDPIFSLRHRIRIQPGTTTRIAYWTLLAASRKEALDLADKHHDPAAFERALTMAWTQAQVQLHHLGIEPDEAHLFQRLANNVLYSDPRLRPSPEVLRRNDKGPQLLWTHGISGDLPIILARIDEAEDLDIIRQLLRAYQYWRLKLLAVDLVILNERAPSYSSELQGALEALLRVNEPLFRRQTDGETPRGAVHVLRSDLVSVEVRTLLRSVARAVLLSRRGSLTEQLKALDEPEAPFPAVPSRPSFSLFSGERIRQKRRDRPRETEAPAQMEFSNGLGGFVDQGREYMVVLEEGNWTPAPWVNVIANPSFGFQVSAAGGCSTWSLNSREYQLTPWSNDPVVDRPGEVIYIRDEASEALWCPTALPIREEASRYVARHGQGYTRFESSSHGITAELLQFVALNDPIKISRLRLWNRSRYSRRLSVTGYVEWVLGKSRDTTAPFILTQMDDNSGAMLARNPWSTEFGGRVACAALRGKPTNWTADRKEFLGRNGSHARPAALVHGSTLSRRVGAGLDPCCALQTRVELGPNQRIEIVFLLGDAASETEARSLITTYQNADLDQVLGRVTRFWDELLGTVQVKTPDRSMDILLNRWLLYQTVASRIWARSAFYQSSGAYGFRDQIQDIMALGLSNPGLAREHLLRAASRQFDDGDVQHWWLPLSGHGVRTRISDDPIWLPFAAAHYVRTTGDRAILDEQVAFLEGPPLHAAEHEAFFQPMTSEDSASLFEHCALALDRSLAVGDHGLPLIGTGDWNDGMNRVGEAGKGESVWLGWFLYSALEAFVPIAEKRGDLARVRSWREHAMALKESLEVHGWDGGWYRRGYFDDGTPLGSAGSSECRIDSIAQSWGVISRAAEPARAAMAMAAVYERLVRVNDGILLLFTPPFDKTTADPGYIKGYPPGLRENGGQYTHGALWAVIAYAMLGDGDRAGALFSLLNPINHALTPSAYRRYKVEPYVVAADVYSCPPHTGRGGWTWYTGSASWMYRTGIEWILGFRVEGNTLVLDPCIPKAWPGFEVLFRHGSSTYEITVENPSRTGHGIDSVNLDGVDLPTALISRRAEIPLAADGATHHIRVLLGSSP